MSSNRLLFALFVGLTTLAGRCQIAQWLIKPDYQSIDFVNSVEGQDMIVTTDDNNYQYLWDMNGARLSSDSIRDMIHPFYGSYAVTTQSRDGALTGFIDANGRFTKVESNAYRVAFSPQFNDGFLLVLDQENHYQFISCVDGMANGLFVEAKPFSNGLASCRTFAQKEKDRYPVLLTSDMQEVSFMNEKGQFKTDDINFISSVNDEGKGLIIYNEQVYIFDRDFPGRPLPVFLYSNGQRDKKKDKQVKILDKQQIITEGANGSGVIRAKAKKDGKDAFINISLDNMLRMTSIQYQDTIIAYQPAIVTKKERSKKLTTTRDVNSSGLQVYGLNWGDKDEMLPPQFQELGQLFDDKAMVRVNGKWGLIKVHPDKKFSIELNNGQRVGFKHSTVHTDIKLNTPKDVGIAPIRDDHDPQLHIISTPENECRISEYRKSDGSRGDGTRPGYVTYECDLSFPKGGFGETFEEDSTASFRSGYETIIKTLNYKGQVEYQGLMSTIIPFQVEAYHQEYITPDVTDSYFQNGNYHFTLELRANEDLPAPLDLNFTLTSPDGYTTRDMYSSRTGNKWEVGIDDISEGINTINIELIVENTDGLGFNYEFTETYTKPRRDQDIQKVQQSTTRKQVKRKTTRRSTVTQQRPQQSTTYDKIDIGSGFSE